MLRELVDSGNVCVDLLLCYGLNEYFVVMGKQKELTALAALADTLVDKGQALGGIQTSVQVFHRKTVKLHELLEQRWAVCSHAHGYDCCLAVVGLCHVLHINFLCFLFSSRVEVAGLCIL